jgi:translocon-associated protein subunit alpha
LDGETFFLYLFLAAGVVLLLVLGQQALASMGKRRGGGSRYENIFYLYVLRHFLHYDTFRLETGTARNTGSVSDDGIDYDWLPPSTIKELSKKLIIL